MMSAITKEIMAKTKAPTGETKALAAFAPKKNNVQIVLKSLFIKRPAIVFEDIKGYSLNGPYLVVQEHDDTQHIYPMDRVETLKLYVTK